MRMTISKACLGLAVLCLAPTASFAAEKSYVCAVHEVFECVAVKGCTPITLAAANLAAVMWIDLEANRCHLEAKWADLKAKRAHLEAKSIDLKAE